MKLKLSDKQINRIAKRLKAQVWQPEDDPSVSISDSIRSWISRLENILEISEGEESFESVFNPYGDTESFDRDTSVKEMLIELAHNILSDKELQ